MTIEGLKWTKARLRGSWMGNRLVLNEQDCKDLEELIDAKIDHLIRKSLATGKTADEIEV